MAVLRPLSSTVASRLIAFFWKSIGIIGCRLAVCWGNERYDAVNLTAVDAILESGRSADQEGEVRYIDGGDLREALHTCVAAIKADKTDRSYSYNQKLLELLKLVTNDHQRLMFFEHTVAPSLLQAGLRETAGLLAVNLAESISRYERTAKGTAVQETLLRHSIHIFPESPFALRSLGYRLEQGGEELRAIELYREGLARSPGRLDLRLLVASSCSPYFSTADQGDSRFSRVSREVQRLVHEIQAFDPPYRNVPNPGRDLGYIPSFSWQYVGRNMRPLMESLCWILAAMTAGLHDATPALHPHRGWNGSPRQVQAPRRAHEPAMGHKEATSHTSSVTMKPSPSTSGHGHDGDVKKITVGVVMERRSNHSPHRLIQGVLEGLDRSRFRVVVFAHGADSDDTYPPAGTAIMEAADEVLIMPWHRFVTGMSDPFVERQVVAKEKVDVLLYMALGNTLGSHLLALGRLAPVQVVFGHGHPVTSGSPAIDYFISSDLFETTTSIEGREVRIVAGTGNDIIDATAHEENVSEVFTSRCSSSSSDSGVQTAVCEEEGRQHHHSAGGSLASTKEPRGRRGRDPWEGRGDGTQDYSEQLVMFDSLTASLPEDFGPPNKPPDARATRRVAGLAEGDHGYHCIQHSKKFHPDFDPVLRGVLLGDPAAKILLTAGSKIHLPRWERTLGPALVPRLVILPYLSHSEMLMVVGQCHVMLDTFPWGAGVTSMETLSAGVPVVTLPARISVLHLAAGQLTELGVANSLVAIDIDDMVRKAVHLATNSALRENISASIIARKGVLSNPHRASNEWENFLERAVRSTVHRGSPS